LVADENWVRKTPLFARFGAKVPLSSRIFGVAIAQRLTDFGRLFAGKGANHGIVTDIP
jgi:hypothetical protein